MRRLNAELAEHAERSLGIFLGSLLRLPPPLGMVSELRRGSPTSLRQGYGRPPQRGCRVGDPGGPPKLQRRRKRLRREGGRVERDLFTISSGLSGRQSRRCCAIKYSSTMRPPTRCS